MIKAKIVGLVTRSVLIGLPLVAIATSVSANPEITSKLKLSQVTKVETPKENSALNPHPRIFSEAPYNRSILVLAEKLRLTKQAPTPENSDAQNAIPSETEVKPWSEAQENRIALVKAINGQFNIRLMNTTNTEVTYELVGHTNQRQLTGNTNFLLQDIAMSRLKVAMEIYLANG